jgi:hypothetical protein
MWQDNNKSNLQAEKMVHVDRIRTYSNFSGVLTLSLMSSMQSDLRGVLFNLRPNSQCLCLAVDLLR